MEWTGGVGKVTGGGHLCDDLVVDIKARLAGGLIERHGDEGPLTHSNYTRRMNDLFQARPE